MLKVEARKENGNKLKICNDFIIPCDTQYRRNSEERNLLPMATEERGKKCHSC